jgi:hypothetical protein
MKCVNSRRLDHTSVIAERNGTAPAGPRKRRGGRRIPWSSRGRSRCSSDHEGCGASAPTASRFKSHALADDQLDGSSSKLLSQKLNHISSEEIEISTKFGRFLLRVETEIQN